MDALITCCLFTGLLMPAQADDDPDGFVEPFPLPNHSLVDLNGNRVALDSLAGKVTIIDFWATWCIPCLKEMPHFEALVQKYRGKGFRMVSLSTDEDSDYVKRFMKEKGLNVSFPILMADTKIRKAFGEVNALPTTFVIDGTGTIVRKYIGFRYRETFENDIRTLLGLDHEVEETDSEVEETWD
ncbi:TlpA family protein disulfide reductase [Caldithrix abyssi]|nr:TlpA family protein disulfide reductase [Caldithrix abyssi]